MIRWGAPLALHALWLLPPLAALIALLVARRERRLRHLVDPGPPLHRFHRRRRALALAKGALWLAACACVVLALARPRWGIRWQEARQRGLDVMIVLDASESMRAADVSPDRLQRAKRAVNDLVRGLSGDRVGLVVFAGSTFLACPLTTDYAAFSMMLDDVRPGTVPRGGTSLAQALRTALKSFDPGGDADRAVVLLTDGEDHEGGLEGAVRALAQERVPVFAVGVGTAEGATIPAPGTPGGLLRDRSGGVVRSALREEALKGIAVATGGIYVRTGADDTGMERVRGLGLSRLRGDGTGARLVKVSEERFQLFLGAAILLLSLEAAMADRVRRREEPAA